MGKLGQGLNKNQKNAISDLLNTLPEVNRVVLMSLMRLLNIIERNSGVNKMDSEALATAFGPVLLFKPDGGGADNLPNRKDIVKIFIENYHTFWPEVCVERLWGSGRGKQLESEMQRKLMFILFYFDLGQRFQGEKGRSKGKQHIST